MSPSGLIQPAHLMRQEARVDGPPLVDGGEFAFVERDFRRARELIYRIAGISLCAGKANLVYSRLARRLRILGMVSFSAYLDYVEQEGSAEREEFVNALTTNLTSFFREAHHFPIFQRLLRDMRDRCARESAVEPLRVWCCASSTGQEPYSMAISAMEAFGSLRPPVRILATDIDTRVLQTAQAGMYAAEAIDKLDEGLRQRYFLKGVGRNAGKVRLRPEVTALIEFRPLNLQEARWPIQPGLAAIFCRNVMIYFDRATQLRILERFAPLLLQQGLLFAGHSENFTHARHLFVSCGHTVYRPLQTGLVSGTTHTVNEKASA